MGARRGLGGFAAGVTVGAAACALLTTGLLGRGADLVGPAAVAGELPAFDDCAQLRQWYVDRAVPLVGPYGFGGGPVVPMFAERSGSSASLDAAGAVGSSGTGTNTQEADVDESDVAKTDGSLVVRLADRSLVVTDVSGAAPVELSRTRLPGPALVRPELLLHDDHVVVVGDEPGPGVGWPEGAAIDRTFLPGRPGDTRAHVISFDLADPAAPTVTDQQVVDGGALSTREYADGTVRVVVTTDFPPLDFVQPNRDRTPAEATRRNREIVRATGIDDWLPGVRSDGGAEHPLLACSEVRHPLQASGFGTISVLTFPFDEPGRTTATAVTAAGDLVYSSATRLYVATTSGGPVLTTGDAPLPRVATTEVHAFALDGGGTTYTGSGSFHGTVEDRWSFSEHDGRLRVAAEFPRDQGPADNGVLVLTERDGRLVETGRVDGLGRGESIRSVRWFGDLAIVVTFRETDPLYTVDLADPDRPRVVGELRIPGFSSYLHPVGGDLLVGVGHDGSADGADLGAQAATFDLRDLSAVRRRDTLGFGPSTDVSAGVDPRAFSYLPDVRVLVTPVQDWARGGARFVALRVGADGSLTETGSWVSRGYGGEDARTLPLGGGRVALVGDVVRVVDVR
ncbi:beta-propeller domain-containing protein [Nocardioides panacis]|uniref:Beta-propeller domain-containing protein n=1 Tax=Nocardioides panacis TaxID=2849501 RepID=A0A975SYR9_9ACTN|nr:beta-propeller domain-containing protein [Nocardioides panacis]QWZ08262.1 beta-propeller domain-containing protein [Nocardioides panacis]